MKRYLDATLKSVSDNGSFVAVASMETVDRDRERIVKGAFEPLPASIPLHAFHNFRDPIGRAVPYYERDALMVAGTFSSTARAQEIRTMVLDGTMGHVSVGFMGAEYETRDGTPTITRAELLEVSLVSVPSNREAAVLSVRGYGGMTVADARRMVMRTLMELAELDLAEAHRALDRSAAAKAAMAEPEPTDIRQVLADAEAFLAELARPATATPPRTKASKAQPREVRCLYDVFAARNAKAFDDQDSAVEESTPTPAPYRPTGPSAYELDRGRQQKDY